jgi:hypothetical protein
MNRKLLFILIIIVSAVFWYWWWPGIKVGPDFPIVSNEVLKSQFNFPFLWTEKYADGLGEYSLFGLWSYPLNLLVGFLANLGLGFEVLEKMFMLTFLILGAYSINRLAKESGLSKEASFIAGLFYLINSYILLLLDGGQIQIALAYAFFPLAFSFFLNALDQGLRKKVVSGLFLFILSFLDLRFLLVLLIVFVYKFFYDLLFLEKKDVFNYLKKWIFLGLINLLIVVGMNFYWIYVLIGVPFPQDLYLQAIKTSTFSFSQIANGLMVLSPNWYSNVYGVVSYLKPEFILIPILIFLAPVLKPKNKQVGFWLGIILLGAFFVKGSNPPLSQVYSWLFNHMPGFSAFRDSSKFFFFITLSASMLIGITCNQILKNISVEKYKKLFVVLISAYFILLAYPVWGFKMTGTFSSIFMEKDFLKIDTYLNNDPSFFRTLWIPSMPPLYYATPNHPLIEAIRLLNVRPYLIGVKGTYEVFNYLRESSFVGELLDISGIGYIVYPPLNPNRGHISKDNLSYQDIFLGQIKSQPWADYQLPGTKVPVIKLKEHQDRFFITNNTFLVFGPDEIYKETTKSTQLKLSKNTFIFADEAPSIARDTLSLPFVKLLLYQKDPADLVLSLISPAKVIFPAAKLNNDPDGSGFWKRNNSDFLFFKDLLINKYGVNLKDFDLGGGFAIGEGSLSLSLEDQRLQKDQLLFARVLESTRSGSIKFSQNDQIIGEIDTSRAGDNFKWKKVGILRDSSPLKIKTLGQVNIINALTALTNLEYQDYLLESQKLTLSNLSDALEGSSSARVSYRRIDPTKYQVNVSGLKAPQMLVFSQTYNSGWVMNGQKSLKVYSFLNGFPIYHDGNYTVEFIPQKFVYRGLWVSGITLLIVIAILIFKRKK